MHTHFLTLARYNVWATALLLDAVAPVGEDDYRRDLGLFFKSIHGTLNHLLVGEHLLWFRRFAEGISPKVALKSKAGRRIALPARLPTPPCAASPPVCRSPPRWRMCSITARTIAGRSPPRSHAWACHARNSTSFICCNRR